MGTLSTRWNIILFYAVIQWFIVCKENVSQYKCRRHTPVDQFVLLKHRRTRICLLKRWRDHSVCNSLLLYIFQVVPVLVEFSRKNCLLRYQVPSNSIFNYFLPQHLVYRCFCYFFWILYTDAFANSLPQVFEGPQVHTLVTTETEWLFSPENVDYPRSIFCWCSSGTQVTTVMDYPHFFQHSLSWLRYCWCRYFSLSRSGEGKWWAFLPSQKTVNQTPRVLKQSRCMLQPNSFEAWAFCYRIVE